MLRAFWSRDRYGVTRTRRRLRRRCRRGVAARAATTRDRQRQADRNYKLSHCSQGKQNSAGIIPRSPMPLSPLLNDYDHVVLDLDGCVWVGDKCTRRAPEAISELRAAGKSLAFVT